MCGQVKPFSLATFRNIMVALAIAFLALPPWKTPPSHRPHADFRVFAAVAVCAQLPGEL
jgi:hypothetical protein